MTSLGLKIVGEEMEVGFTVSSRDELNVAIDRLYAMADTIWSASAAAQAPADDAGPMPERMQIQGTIHPLDQLVNGQGSNEIERLKAWREQQGLR